MGVGWWIGDYNGVFAEIESRPPVSAMTSVERDAEEEAKFAMIDEPQRRFVLHFQLGLATALATVLINSLSVTYLIGTGRWIKEVCETYGLNSKYVVESTRLKRISFPMSIAGVMTILAIVAFGAAADPATLGESTAQWVTPHMIVAMVGTCIIIGSIMLQAMNLQRNAEIINEVVAEVQRERLARGLPVE